MSIWANSLTVLVATNECLSNCFIYDQECCYRHYGAENVDWQSLAFTLWPKCKIVLVKNSEQKPENIVDGFI